MNARQMPLYSEKNRQAREGGDLHRAQLRQLGEVLAHRRKPAKGEQLPLPFPPRTR